MGTHCKKEVEEEESVLHTLDAGLHPGAGLRLLTGWLADKLAGWLAGGQAVSLAGCKTFMKHNVHVSYNTK